MRLDQQMRHDALTLDRLRVFAQTRIGPQVLHDLSVESWRDPMLDDLVVSLQSTLYGRIEDTRTVTRRVYFASAEYASAWQHVKAEWFPTFSTWWKGFWCIGWRRWPHGPWRVRLGMRGIPLRRTTEQWREVALTVDLWRAFPDNTQVFPPSLGHPQMFVQERPTDSNVTGQEGEE